MCGPQEKGPTGNRKSRNCSFFFLLLAYFTVSSNIHRFINIVDAHVLSLHKSGCSQKLFPMGKTAGELCITHGQRNFFFTQDGPSACKRNPFFLQLFPSALWSSSSLLLARRENHWVLVRKLLPKPPIWGYPCFLHVNVSRVRTQSYTLWHHHSASLEKEENASLQYPSTFIPFFLITCHWLVCQTRMRTGYVVMEKYPLEYQSRLPGHVSTNNHTLS